MMKLSSVLAVCAMILSNVACGQNLASLTSVPGPAGSPGPGGDVKVQGEPNKCEPDKTQLDRKDKVPFDFTLPVSAEEIKIMEYNVENLFDTVHDDGKEDWDFLPVDHPLKAECKKSGPNFVKPCETTNWNQNGLDIKLNQIKKIVDSQGDFPDLLAIEEIENEAVASQLAKTLGYKDFAITNSKDIRGIDVALFFRNEKLEKIEDAREFQVEIDTSTCKQLKGADAVAPEKITETRPILGMYFRLRSAIATRSEVLAVYVNHWPSQGNSSCRRNDAAKVLRHAIDVDTERFGAANLRVVAMGDFNTIPNDVPHPFAAQIQNPEWTNHLLDVQTTFERRFAPGDKSGLAQKIPKGTYFFGGDMAWNRLDVFFVSQNLLNGSGMGVKLDTFRVIAPEFATSTFNERNKNSFNYGTRVQGTPRRYNHNAATAEEAGFSDHFPILMKLSL